MINCSVYIYINFYLGKLLTLNNLSLCNVVATQHRCLGGFSRKQAWLAVLNNRIKKTSLLLTEGVSWPSPSGKFGERLHSKGSINCRWRGRCLGNKDHFEWRDIWQNEATVPQQKASNASKATRHKTMLRAVDVLVAWIWSGTSKHLVKSGMWCPP